MEYNVRNDHLISWELDYIFFFSPGPYNFPLMSIASQALLTMLSMPAGCVFYSDISLPRADDPANTWGHSGWGYGGNHLLLEARL